MKTNKMLQNALRHYKSSFSNLQSRFGVSNHNSNNNPSSRPKRAAPLHSPSSSSSLQSFSMSKVRKFDRKQDGKSTVKKSEVKVSASKTNRQLLEEDMFAEATTGARSSAVQKFKQIIGHGVEGERITAEEIYEYAAELKARLPQSGVAYLSHIKTIIEQDGKKFPISAGEYKRCITSIEKSMKPPAQDTPLLLQHLRPLVAEPKTEEEKITVGAIVRCWFLAARVNEMLKKAKIQFFRDEKGTEVMAYDLSSTGKTRSKTGQGVRARFICACGRFPNPGSGVPLCPVHCLDDEGLKKARSLGYVKILKNLRSLLTRAGVDKEEDGERCRWGTHSAKIGPQSQSQGQDIPQLPAHSSLPQAFPQTATFSQGPQGQGSHGGQPSQGPQGPQGRSTDLSYISRVPTSGGGMRSTLIPSRSMSDSNVFRMDSSGSMNQQSQGQGQESQSQSHQSRQTQVQSQPQPPRQTVLPVSVNEGVQQSDSLFVEDADHDDDGVFPVMSVTVPGGPGGRGASVSSMSASNSSGSAAASIGAPIRGDSHSVSVGHSLGHSVGTSSSIASADASGGAINPHSSHSRSHSIASPQAHSARVKYGRSASSGNSTSESLIGVIIDDDVFGLFNSQNFSNS